MFIQISYSLQPMAAGQHGLATQYVVHHVMEEIKLDQDHVHHLHQLKEESCV